MTEKGGNDGNVWEWRGRIVGMFFFGVLAFVGGVLGLQGLAVLPSGFVVLGLPVLAVVWFLLRLFDGREINTNNSGQGINTSNSGREIVSYSYNGESGDAPNPSWFARHTFCGLTNWRQHK